MSPEITMHTNIGHRDDFFVTFVTFSMSVRSMSGLHDT